MKIRYLFMVICCLAMQTSLQASESGTVDIHGFISQGYMISDENNYFAETKDGTFQFNEMGINFVSKLTPNLRVGLQFFARDLGDLGNDKITVDWVFGDYYYREWLGLRVGKIKIPLGFYNEVRDIDMVRTFIYLPQSVYQERYRESWVALKGASLYGKVGSDALGTLGYQFQLGSIEAGKDSGAAKHFESLSGYFEITEDFDIGLTYAGKLEWQAPVIPLRLAVSSLMYDFVVTGKLKDAFNPTPGLSLTIQNITDEYRVIVGSMEYTWGNLILAAEYSEIYTDAKFRFSPVTASLPDDDMEITMQGYYGSIAYRLFDWLELGAYYSEYYPDKDDKDGENIVAAPFNYKKKFQAWSKDACLSARFDINMNWIIKLEGHVMNGAADLFESDNYNEDTPVVNYQPVLDIEENWMLFALKVSYSF